MLYMFCHNPVKNIKRVVGTGGRHTEAADFSSCLKNEKETGNGAMIDADLTLCACVWLNTKTFRHKEIFF